MVNVLTNAFSGDIQLRSWTNGPWSTVHGPPGRPEPKKWRKTPNRIGFPPHESPPPPSVGTYNTMSVTKRFVKPKFVMQYATRGMVSPSSLANANHDAPKNRSPLVVLVDDTILSEVLGTHFWHGSCSRHAAIYNIQSFLQVFVDFNCPCIGGVKSSHT